jgi:hypothetical protein
MIAASDLLELDDEAFSKFVESGRNDGGGFTFSNVTGLMELSQAGRANLAIWTT